VDQRGSGHETHTVVVAVDSEKAAAGYHRNGPRGQREDRDDGQEANADTMAERGQLADRC
jgi:hypothetical protein